MPTDDSLIALLAPPPRCPTKRDLVSPNPMLGEPGIYPEGRPIVPAARPATSEAATFGAPLLDAFVAGNIVPVRAGR